MIGGDATNNSLLATEDRIPPQRREEHQERPSRASRLRGESDQTYDSSSNRTQLKAQIGTTNDFLSNYTFDALDRVTRITQQSQTGGNAVAAKRIDLDYRSLVHVQVTGRPMPHMISLLPATQGNNPEHWPFKPIA